MMFDRDNMFSNKQSVGTAQATVLATDVMDLGSVLPHIGKGKSVDVYVQVTTSVAGSGATINFQLITDTVANMASPTVVDSTGVLALTALVAGMMYKLNIPPNWTPERYLSVQFVVATANPSAGNFSAGILLDAQSAAYAEGDAP